MTRLEHATSLFAHDRLIVPGAVDLKRGGLVWHHSARQRGQGIEVPRDLLRQFMALLDEPDDAIAGFARRFGILGLCKHDVPRSHKVVRAKPSMGGADMVLEDEDEGAQSSPFECVPLKQTCKHGDWQGREPVAGWRQWIRDANDIVRVAAIAHGVGNMSTAAAQETWERLSGEKWMGDPRDRMRQIRVRVAGAVQLWLELGGVQPQFWWAPDMPVSMNLGCRSTAEPAPLGELSILWAHAQGTTLFGALALQLATHVAQVDGLAFCSNCFRPYIAKRRPAASRQNYCDRCRNDGAPLRYGQQQRRKRLRENG